MASIMDEKPPRAKADRAMALAEDVVYVGIAVLC